MRCLTRISAASALEVASLCAFCQCLLHRVVMYSSMLSCSVPPLHHASRGLHPHAGGHRPSQTKLKDSHRSHVAQLTAILLCTLSVVVVVSMSSSSPNRSGGIASGSGRPITAPGLLNHLASAHAPEIFSRAATTCFLYNEPRYRRQ